MKEQGKERSSGGEKDPARKEGSGHQEERWVRVKPEQRGNMAAEAPERRGDMGGEMAMRSLMSLKKAITLE